MRGLKAIMRAAFCRPSFAGPLALLLAALTMLPAGLVHAVCVCGFSDGQFTTHTGIVLDGNLADWAPIHADPDNNICDGPAGGIADLDAPVQSTGRDIAHFAFTWDDADLFIFTERVGSSSNVQRFVYYADTDNDGLMETGERVIGVSWQGNTGLIEVYLFEYVSAAAGGDPLVDGLGFADGYTLPGGFQNVPKQSSPTRVGNWGSSTQQQMEFRITWAELGLAPGTPFTFHVSSSNTYFNAANYPDKIDDNLGGCGGGGGSTQFAALTFVPDLALSGPPGAVRYGAHTLTNDGNGDDVFDLSSVVGGAHTPAVSYYLDADASGTLTAGDSLLSDTDGDSIPDTGTLASGATVALLIEYAIENNGPGDPTGVATIVTTATSSFAVGVQASVTDTVTVILAPDLLVMKSVATTSDPFNGTTNPKAIPGATVGYTVQVTNLGFAAVDTNSIVVTDPIPANSALVVADYDGLNPGPVAFVDGPPISGLSYTFTSLASTTDDVAFSNDGGATYSYTPGDVGDGTDPAVTHIQVNPKGALAAAGVGGNPSFQILFKVRVQ